jgi:hypothetical protein
MVVESGVVEERDDGETYIVLTLANSAGKVEIKASKLVDVYTAAKAATQVQLAVVNGVISATLVAGGVDATALAADAVTTVKIADGNVTKAKLSTTVQASLDKADSAVQKVVTGTANGTVAVDGTDVAVKGLGSAAYTEASAYDAAGTAASKVAELKESVDANAANITTIMGDKTVTGSIKQQVSSMQTSLSNSIGDVEGRVSDIEDKDSDFETRIAALENVEWVDTTDAEIEAMFA